MSNGSRWIGDSGNCGDGRKYGATRRYAMVGFVFRLAFGEDDTWGRVASAIAFVNLRLRVSSSIWVDGVSETRLPPLTLYGW